MAMFKGIPRHQLEFVRIRSEMPQTRLKLEENRRVTRKRVSQQIRLFVLLDHGGLSNAQSLEVKYDFKGFIEAILKVNNQLDLYLLDSNKKRTRRISRFL